MLTAQVVSPLGLHLELGLFLPQMLFNQFDSVSVGHPCEGGVNDVLKTRFQVLVERVEELDVVSVVLKDVSQAVLDIVFGTVHDVRQFSEAQLRLDHPELGQVAGGVAMLGSESWAESVNITHAAAVGLYIDLTTDSKEGWLSEEVSLVVELALFERNQRSFFLFLFLSRGTLSGRLLTLGSWLVILSRISTLLLVLFCKLLCKVLGDRFLILFPLFKLLANALNQLHGANWLVRGWHARGYLEHLTSAFAVASSDNRRVDVLKAAFLEELVRRIRQVVAHPHH